MRILYIAKHGQINSNDDEGAITWALKSLGHAVIPLQEERGGQDALKHEADVCLFHKWDDYGTLQRLEGRMLRVFWYFDLVDYPDPRLESRNTTRRNWMEKILPYTDLGFCTDGTWVSRVNRDGKGKLVWLMQGADERVAIPCGLASPLQPVHDILFTGIAARGGEEREQFVREMQARYGQRFKHVTNGVHGEQLARLIAESRVVVAPSSPVAASYWSNRVYLMQGFRACVLHPRCDRLMDHYQEDEEIVFYDSMNELHRKIDYLLNKAGTRQRIAANGYTRTLKEHTYRHRVMKLLETLRERKLV